jgi:bifunctional ADP-heptose synthase (sugar kinase/adenylyltransferase)
VRPARSKIVAPEGLRLVVDDARRRGSRRVALARGDFDVLHPGIVRYLDLARAAADVLAVAVIEEERCVDRRRPLPSPEARAGMVAAVRSVDHVTIVRGVELGALIRTLRPDVFCTAVDAPPSAAESVAARAAGARSLEIDARLADERVGGRAGA